MFHVIFVAVTFCLFAIPFACKESSTEAEKCQKKVFWKIARLLFRCNCYFFLCRQLFNKIQKCTRETTKEQCLIVFLHCMLTSEHITYSPLSLRERNLDVKSSSAEKHSMPSASYSWIFSSFSFLKMLLILLNYVSRPLKA